MNIDSSEVTVKGVMPTSNSCAIFLGNDDRTFVIYVDPAIGNAINMTINQVKKERPLTHDLIGLILKGLEASIERVLINDVDEGTFARIILRMENELGKKIIELDARPSDSIVLALQMKKPIFAANKVLENVEDMSEILERILKRRTKIACCEFVEMLTPRIEIPVGTNSLCPSALAPMQDVTGLPFMTIIGERVSLTCFSPNFFVSMKTLGWILKY